PVTTGLDSGEMHEHIVATPVLRDKSEPLVRVEPLHRALRHSRSPARRTPTRNTGPKSRPEPVAIRPRHSWTQPADSSKATTPAAGRPGHNPSVLQRYPGYPEH